MSVRSENMSKTHYICSTISAASNDNFIGPRSSTRGRETSVHPIGPVADVEHLPEIEDRGVKLDRYSPLHIHPSRLNNV